MLPVRRVQNGDDRHTDENCRLRRRKGILKDQALRRLGPELRSGVTKDFR